MSRAALLAAAALIVVLIVPAAVPAQSSEGTLPDIEDEVMCPVCKTTLEVANGPQADRQRALIRRLIDEGRSKDEIKDVLVAEYGEDVLATTSSEGFEIGAWLVPALGFAGALALLGLGVARLRRRPDQPEDGEAPPVSSADSARLERDLSSYDL